MIRFATIPFLLILTTSCGSQDKSISTPKLDITESTQSPREMLSSTLSMKDSISAWEMGYCSPLNHANTALPLIIYLHGGIGTERSDKGAKAWEMMSFLTDSYPAILVSPSANRYVPWWSKTGVQRILLSIEEMKKRYKIDTTKIFLTGVSDGATALIALASIQNHPFAGFIGASGNPLFFDQTTHSKQLATTPIHLFIAGKDHLYPAKIVQSWCDSLKTDGVPITYTIKPQSVHGFDFKIEEKMRIISLLNTWKRNK